MKLELSFQEVLSLIYNLLNLYIKFYHLIFSVITLLLNNDRWSNSSCLDVYSTSNSKPFRTFQLHRLCHISLADYSLARCESLKFANYQRITLKSSQYLGTSNAFRSLCGHLLLSGDTSNEVNSTTISSIRKHCTWLLDLWFCSCAVRQLIFVGDNNVTSASKRTTRLILSRSLENN